MTTPIQREAADAAPSHRPILILELLTEANRPMTASEIHRALDLPKQTIHRLCNAMEAQGLLERLPRGRALLPGPRARRLGSGLMAMTHGTVSRHQILAGLAREVGETANLVAAGQPGMYYVDRVETNWPIRVQLPIGSHVPFHCTASGKVFLSTRPRDERARLVKTLPLDGLTDRTITDPDALLDELMVVETQGFAIDDCEFIPHMTAIAVPVLDDRGRFHAAIAVHGPSTRFPREAALDRHGTLAAASRRMTEHLFGPAAP